MFERVQKSKNSVMYENTGTFPLQTEKKIPKIVSEHPV